MVELVGATGREGPRARHSGGTGYPVTVGYRDASPRRRWMPFGRGREQREWGAAMVEFAIVLPLLMLLVFGIIEFGRAHNTQLTLTHAAREGVRTYAITQDAAQGEAIAEQAATTLDPALMDIQVTACDIGSPTTMTIRYPFQFFIPFLPSTPINLQAEGVMKCGG